MKLTVEDLTRQIENLMVQYPELAEDETLRADMFEGETDLHWIMSRLVELDADAKGMAGAISDRSKELAERKARFIRRSEAMRRMMQGVLERADLRKVELPVATISLRSTPPGVEVEDETCLPEYCFETKRVLSKSKIKEALSEGEVPGAHMTNGGQTISVRVK